MIASRAESGDARAWQLAAAVIASALLGSACATSPAPVPEVLLDLPAQQAARAPDEADRAAARLAAAALVARDGVAPPVSSAPPAGRLGAAPDMGLERARGELERTARDRAALLGDAIVPSEDPKRLVALGRDVTNATLSDPVAYRDASAALLDTLLLNPAHRARLARAVADDPKRLADRRIRDHYESYWAQGFNAVATTAGSNLLSGVALAPYTASMAAVHFVASLWERPRVSVQQRQALKHWKDYVARHPGAADTPKTHERIAKMQRRLDRLRRENLVDAGRALLERDQPNYAARIARQALAVDDAHGADGTGGDRSDAQALLEAAEARAATLRRLRNESLEAQPEAMAEFAGSAETARASLALARALLGRDNASRVAERAGALQRDPDAEALRDEADFALALAQAELGYETRSWERLDDVASRRPERANMARHAATLVLDPRQNPYGDFRSQLARGGRERASHRLVGPWSQRPRYSRLPSSLAYAIDAPAVAQSVITAPIRLLLEPFQPQPDFRGPAAVAAYRYLARHPEGEQRSEVLHWLLDYEDERDRPHAALRIADFIPEIDPARREALLERAAEKQLETVERVDRPDHVQAVLRNVVRAYPDSQAGRSAGLRAREHALETRAQQIRLTRGFLGENPTLTGPRGLGLRPALLDGDPRNGELHPRGVSLVGGRRIEIALLAPNGDDERAPRKVDRELHPEQLARCVALLEEATLLGARLDPDDTQAPDAQRDVYFERARLGLADDVPFRPEAHSSYVYRGVKERYGVVRGRESVLPFDLVLRGSLRDLSLGAFPRWREPETTPDAFLYR